MHSAVAAAALASLLYGASPVIEQQLWSERPTASPPLAQVPDFAALAKQVIPAVVSIQVQQVQETRPPGEYNDPYEFFFRPFGGEVPREFHNRGLGSGVIIRRDGLILTNYHVVENADEIEVTYEGPDKAERKVKAKVLGIAPEYDVALLKTNEDANASVAYLGNSDTVAIGDWVMAVGNPFGLSHSVSVGIISAKERRDIMPSGRRGLYDFLQTDASINPGNSGGPLINMRGEVIGLNSAINAAGSGIGFAIPINMIKEMLPDLQTKGKYTRSWLGIRIQPVTEDLAQSYGLKVGGGALVAEVIANGPAQAAGIQAEDVIIEFDGKPLRSSTDLPLFASMAGVGKTVKVKVWRKGKEKTFSVTLTEFPGSEAAAATSASQSGPTGLGIGMTVADITPPLKEQYKLETPHGVVIKEVESGTPAAEANLRPGDVIVSINGKRVQTARDFRDQVVALTPGTLMRLEIRRAGARIFVAMKKPAARKAP